jgi:uncharacterized membrane protein YagU involved in acid resistance
MNAISLPNAASPARRFLLAVVCGGIGAGTIDLTFAFTAFGVAPKRILQYIASGLLGAQAFDGGWSTALIGVIAHYTILLVAAALYCAASRRMTWMVRHALPSGIAFGVAIYCFMNFVVLPLSAVSHTSTATWLQRAPDFAVHMLLLGPAIAFAVKFFDKPAAR